MHSSLWIVRFIAKRPGEIKLRYVTGRLTHVGAGCFKTMLGAARPPCAIAAESHNVGMLFVLHRSPKPDARQWTGRRWLALLDALFWPAAVIAVVAALPGHGGAVGAGAIVLCALFAASRTSRALFRNERYWFTTWRWAGMFAVLLATGVLLKLLAT